MRSHQKWCRYPIPIPMWVKTWFFMWCKHARKEHHEGLQYKFPKTCLMSSLDNKLGNSRLALAFMIEGVPICMKKRTAPMYASDYFLVQTLYLYPLPIGSLLKCLSKPTCTCSIHKEYAYEVLRWHIIQISLYFVGCDLKLLLNFKLVPVIFEREHGWRILVGPNKRTLITWD